MAPSVLLNIQGNRTISVELHSATLWLKPQVGLVTPLRACGPAGGSVATGMKKISYRGYRFPPEIIQQAIWRLRPNLAPVSMLVSSDDGRLVSGLRAERTQVYIFRKRKRK
jgi:hypothetical protein